MSETGSKSKAWLMLLPQLPAKPSYFRVKIWRRLQALGAVSIKNAAYLLPATEEAREDFEWLRREIEQGGGEAAICETQFIDGQSDDDAVAAFNAARERDYLALAEEIRADAGGEERSDRRSEAWRARYARIVAIDFFGAPAREIVDALLAERTSQPQENSTGDQAMSSTGKTWVTRADIKVDRIASAWLIARFIDKAARFKFVAQRDYTPLPGELRFDMFDGEYTHRGDRCTFEVLVDSFVPGDAALRAVAEIIHDLDLKDDKFARPETAGVAALLQGLTSAHRHDEERLRRGGELFDGLYGNFAGAGK